jgi:hypothetical protein
MTASSPPSSRIALLTECYARSLALLRANTTPHGILACSAGARAAARRYLSVFGRDAAICALGMAASGESDLLEGARAGLRTLAHHQAPNGQIPKYVRPECGETDFWYTGCIDATLWWLLAVDFVDRHAPGEGLAAELQAGVRCALQWLACQEHQSLFLLQQNEASDWADIMPRSGYVLYTNALWYLVKRLYALPRCAETRYHFNHLFLPFGRDVPAQRRARVLGHYVRNRARRTDAYLSFVNLSFWGEEVDVLGNALAVLAGLPEDSHRARQVLRALQSLRIDEPYPVRVVGTPLHCDHPQWRRYMQRHRQNHPHQYHNGGIWPFVGGFWAMLLARLGHREEAWRALEGLAEANAVNEWAFNEWLHGRTGEPAGMAGQSWNAAMFVLAYRAVHDGMVWPSGVPHASQTHGIATTDTKEPAM